MKLTKENIQFIDNYLQNSGVKYIDIRYEMTDHVATALEAMEGDFHDNFKEYMLQHKKELLNSNAKFIKAAGRRAVKILLKNMVKPVTIMAFILFFTTAEFLNHYFGKEWLAETFTMGYLLFGICFIVYYRYYKRAVSAKYSVADKLQAIVPVSLYVVLVIIKPERIISNISALIIFYSFFTAVMISHFITYGKLISKYRTQYNV
jgi:cation transport ATPase